MKTISVALDDELYAHFQLALKNAAALMGVNSVSASAVLRQLISSWCGDPRPPFESGWHEGYRAAYGAAMRCVEESLHDLANGGPVNGLGLGMSSPYDERAPRRDREGG